MANIKSAKKRIIVNQKRALRNKSVKSSVKTEAKKLQDAIDKADKAAATEQLQVFISAISKATSKGIYHKNTTARRISRVTKAVNQISA